jgi:hypothetical protein
MLPAPDLTTIDPQDLVPTLGDFPPGTTLSTFMYVSTAQASRRNGIPLSVLHRTGREIGYDRDFQVPGYGDIEVETVRFRTHSGMARAYSYFMTMVPHTTVPAPATVRGVGERSAIALIEGGGFVEFMRGRYYVVISAVPATTRAVALIESLAHLVDRRIRTYSASA